MASPLFNLIRSDGPQVFYNEGFRRELEVHIPLLKSGSDARIIEVEDNIAYKYEYDFFGLLTYLKIPAQYHWITMRVNNMMHPDEYSKDILSVLLPDVVILEQLRTTYTTAHRSL